MRFEMQQPLSFRWQENTLVIELQGNPLVTNDFLIRPENHLNPTRLNSNKVPEFNGSHLKFTVT